MSQDAGLLILILFMPLMGAVALAFCPKEQHTWFKYGALGISVVTLLLSIFLLYDFPKTNNADFWAVTAAPWIPQLNIQFKVGVDGISLSLVLLTTLLTSIAILSSWESIRDRVKEYYICLLLLETGMLGVFAALDLILFYVFWEAMLVPMYFLIGIWGGPRKAYATIKFVLYTLAGSLLMLVAILWLYVATLQSGQGGTFDLVQMLHPMGPLQTSALSPEIRLWLYLAFAVAFAIKVPMWPFHTWLPDAHVEAPTAGSVILAGVLLKMGTYGFLRFCIPLFPDVAIQTAPWFMALSVIGIIYGALVAYVQPDVKRLVAYSSVSHLGFCMLGLFAFTWEGVSGSVLQMINHGLSTGALFLLVGMIYERRHTREIAAFGGLWKVIPLFSVFFLITVLSSVGLPGLNGFVGEFLILLGTWPAGNVGRIMTVLGATGVILGAVYLLWMFQRVMQGPLDRPENQRMKDMGMREIITMFPLILGMFWIGIFPNSVLGLFNESVSKQVLDPIRRAREAMSASAASAGMPTSPMAPSTSMPGMPGMPGMPPGQPPISFPPGMPPGSVSGARPPTARPTAPTTGAPRRPATPPASPRGSAGSNH
jgi:NADH-quinone oxidoreductase subunit M